MAAEKRKQLTSDEVCRIIETCNVNGVGELTFSGLTLKMGRPTQTAPAPGPDLVDTVTQEQIQMIQKEISAEDLLAEEIDTRQEQLAQMLLEDPAEAERLILTGELEDDDRADPDEP